MKVVSFCLYGTAEHYRVGAIRNAELCRTIYPDWDIWFYVSPTIPSDIVNKLIALDCRIIVVEAPDNAYFMIYRYLPCCETQHEVEYAIFRDTDSRIDEREAAAVEAWLRSGKSLHIMRDHLLHKPHPKDHMLLGGMWGVKCSTLRDFVQIARKCATDTVHGTDQRILSRYVYPRYAKNNDICVHDDIFDKQPFPTARSWIEIDKELLPLFVGCQFDSNDKPQHISHLVMLKQYLNNPNACDNLNNSREGRTLKLIRCLKKLYTKH